MSLLRFANWTTLFRFVNYFHPIQFLNQEPEYDDLLSVREHLKLDIHLFEMNENFAVPHYQPNLSRYSDKLNILTKNSSDITTPALICNPKLISPVRICTRRVDCRYQTNRLSNFVRHSSEICESNSKTQIICQQQMFGNGKKLLRQLIELHYLPPDVENYSCKHFAAFDIGLV